MARGIAYLVFLLPVVVSVPIAAFVMSDILADPGRTLDMMPAAAPKSIEFAGVVPVHNASEPLLVQVRVLDMKLDCGDLYVTLYDSDRAPVTQEVFLEQCIGENRDIPIRGLSLELESGQYTITAELLSPDKRHTESISMRVTAR